MKSPPIPVRNNSPPLNRARSAPFPPGQRRKPISPTEKPTPNSPEHEPMSDWSFDSPDQHEAPPPPTVRRSRTVGDLDDLMRPSSARWRNGAVFRAPGDIRKISPSERLNRRKSDSFGGKSQPCWVVQQRSEEHAKSLAKIAAEKRLAESPEPTVSEYVPRKRPKPWEEMYYYRRGIQDVVAAIGESKKSRDAFMTQ